MKKKVVFRNIVLLLSLLGLMVNMGCVNRTPKKYLRSNYLDKARISEQDSRKYSKFQIQPSVKEQEKTENPKKKIKIWPFGQKDSARATDKVSASPPPVKIEAKRTSPKKKFRIWPFGKKDSARSADKVSASPPPVKIEAKRTSPKEKFRIWPFGQKSPDGVAGKGAAQPSSQSTKSAKKGPSSGSESILVSAAKPYRYRMKYGDPIVINLRGIPNAAPIEERIDENGNIKLDYIGSVYAFGKTAAELEDDIERAYLDQKIYRNLSVSVQLPQRSYFIRGEVLKPGRFSLLGGVSIVQAIATAGGFNDFANSKDVLIVRGGKNIKINVRDIERNPSRDVQIEEGDVIVVKRSFL